MLKPLKWRQSRKCLENVYQSYIRPLLEYGAELWDPAKASLIEMLDKVQIQAARIITGATARSCLENLYEETGWERLQDRRRRAKLNLFYKIITKESPNYLISLLPQSVGRRTSYNLRNKK